MMITVAEIMATVLDTLMLVWFVPKFVGVSINKRLWVLLIPLIQLTVQLSFDWLMPGYNLLPMIVMFFLVFAFSVALSPKTVLWDLISSIAYISLMMLVNTFLFSIFSFFIDNMTEILQGTDGKIRVLYLVIAKLALFFSYYLVLVLFKKDKGVETPNAIMSLVLVFSTVVSLSAIMKIAAVINPGAIDGPVFIIATVLVAVNVILYLFIHQIQRLQKSRYELMLINERIAHEAKQAEEVNTVWNNIRKVRHDMLAGV